MTQDGYRDPELEDRFDRIRLQQQQTAVFLDILKSYMCRPLTQRCSDWYREKGWVMFESLFELLPQAADLPTPDEFENNVKKRAFVLALIGKTTAQILTKVAPEEAAYLFIREEYDDMEES